MIARDFDGARQAFLAADESLNGFHSAYDIAKFLGDSKASGKDPEQRRQAYNTILAKHSWGAPKAALDQLRAEASR